MLFKEGPRIFEEIIKSLLHKGIVPKVVACPTIYLVYLVEIREISVRFINLYNFVDVSLKNLCQTVGMSARFFPFRWNKKSMYSYNSHPPTLNDFFDFEDTSSNLEEKTLYITSLFNKKYQFKRELLRYSKYCLELIFRVGIQFLENSFACQDFLYTHLDMKQSKLRFPYIHPFHPPIFTKAAYAYRLLLTFCPDINKIIFMRKPVNMQSSLGELEYCFFLRHIYKNGEFQDAWSPAGQKYFKESVPDSYSLLFKKAYFFNGCLIHGHCKEKCRFQRST